MKAEKGSVLVAVFLSAVVCVHGPTLAQAAQDGKQATETTVSAISGKVFAITKGGDLKPARLATVYLIYHHSKADSRALQDGKLTTAGTVFDEANSKRSDLETKSAQNMNKIVAVPDGGARFREIMEQSYMLAVHIRMEDARIAAVKWAKNNAPEQVQEVKADEEGAFKVTARVPGHYLLVVMGRAGMNNAIWMETLDVELGKEYVLKLSSPACSYLATS